MKILIFGSTYLSAITSNFLIKNSDYRLVGYVANKKRLTIPGNMPIKEVSEDADCDIILSLQYDQMIKDINKSFNVHPGLLPEYGGIDILYHTIKNKSFEQGITFHKITKSLDYGPILSRISYPVFSDDTVEILYERMSVIFPLFVLSNLKLLEMIPCQMIDKCHSVKPNIYNSSQIADNDIKKYRETGVRLKNKFGVK